MHKARQMKAVFDLIVLLVMASSVAAAEQSPEHIDPLRASPGIYRMLLENEYVRVLEYTLQPGQREAWHTHPPKVSYMVSGGKLRITTEDGKSFVVTENADNAVWMGAVGRHFGENVGSTVVRIVLIEIKSLADAPFEAIGKPE